MTSPTSSPSSAPLLVRIDEFLRPRHVHLAPDDECYALREYTVRKGFEHSATNSLILNLKKSPTRADRPQEWHYKQRAIAQAARELRDAMGFEWLREATLVPMPPSRVASDPEYDDRMLRVLRELGPGEALDVRPLLVQRATMIPSHLGLRASVADLRANYMIEPTVDRPRPSAIFLFDDLLTRGTHFRAAKMALQAHYGPVPVTGFFLARAVHDVDPGQLPHGPG